ncbi:MAG: HD domain-containing protein [Chloroflexi bacterium]|nr:MAG: HD domain-containing protein [Chloroflexota bacterium]
MSKPLRVLHSTKPYAQHVQGADAAGVVRLKPLNPTVRLSELVASLSIGTDIGMGQPEGQALRTCHLALGVAREMGLDQKQCADVYYIALLRFVGCNSHADQDAAGGGGDEMAMRRALAPVISGEPQELVPHVVRHVGAGLPAGKRVRVVAGMLAAGPKHARAVTTATCEVARMFATQLGLGAALVRALGYQFEYWNGKGLPDGVSGEQIPIAARIVMVARDLDVVTRVGGRQLGEAMLRRRRGRAYDPAVADAFHRHAWSILAGIEEESLWDQVIEADPMPSDPLDADGLNVALECCAQFADIKCWFTRDHSPAVSNLARRAAANLGLDAIDVETIAAAGLVQELGKTGVQNGILESQRPLTNSQWDTLRLSTFLTQRILARCHGLEAINALASSHHERLDGSGYHRGLTGDRISKAARILAAADAFKALTSDRPWRTRLAPDAAARTLGAEVKEGKLAHDAVEAVLGVAGHGDTLRRKTWPSGLSDREIDVLRLISLGRTNREVAERLFISPKTVGRHIENIYAKIGVSTRPAATLFAMQHQLLS